MSQMRGTSVLATLDFLHATFGESSLERVLAALPADSREQLGDRAAILPGSWYDASMLSELTRTADELLGKGDLALARIIGKHVAFADVNRFFRWLFRLAGPKALFSRAGSVWNSYYDTGSYVLETIEDGRAVLRIEEWDAADEVLCRRLEGWIERAVELTLGPKTRPEIRETHHRAHDPDISAKVFCRFEVRWAASEESGAETA
jgi:hypothetical protein